MRPIFITATFSSLNTSGNVQNGVGLPRKEAPAVERLPAVREADVSSEGHCVPSGSAQGRDDWQSLVRRRHFQPIFCDAFQRAMLVGQVVFTQV
jgi:hypothetical protein